MNEVIKKIRELLDPMTSSLDYYVVDVTYKREGKRFVLRVILDKQGGITMEECAKLNTDFSELLDKENVIEDQYTLEVSSPGLDRKLKKDGDFAWAVGKKIRVNTYVPLEGRNTFSGMLVGLGEGTVVINESGTSTEVPRDKISSAKLNEIDDNRGVKT